MSIKRSLLDNIKNIYGWKTNRKILVLSIDDYGNVRMDSKRAKENMLKAGLKIRSAFDLYDSLETREDLEALYETLSSVKDKNGNSAIFTPFAVPCNINFEKIKENGFQKYEYEILPATFKKMEARDPKAYSGSWELWQEGIKENLLRPQFHGREHLNIKVFDEKLDQKDRELLIALENRSNINISKSGYSTISYTAAFEFWDFKENKHFEPIIEDGLSRFEEVYGYRAVHFNPPKGSEHPIIHKTLKAGGIKYSDTPLLKQEHQGKGKYKKIFNYTGKKNKAGIIYQVRNVVFEPFQERGIDWVQYSLEQIGTAFTWGKPAILSSHRINFCGNICPENRKKGLFQLKKLLKEVVKRWPEVEFISADQLGSIIENNER